MKATEVRLNNLVYFKFNSKKQIHSIIPKDIRIMNICECTFKNESECYYPIPLTEEILLKCGFKTLDKYTFVFKGFFIHKRKRGFIYGKNKIIKFTHKLQNLYFELTGQELEINL